MLILDLSEYPGKYDGLLTRRARGSLAPSKDFFSISETKGFLLSVQCCVDKSKQDMSNGYNETKEVCFKIHSCFKSRDKKSHA